MTLPALDIASAVHLAGFVSSVKHMLSRKVDVGVSPV